MVSIVAFDCDGVMFDTREANRAYYNRILSGIGKAPLTDRQFDYAQMHTVDESLSFLIPEPHLLEAAYAMRRQMGYGPFIAHMVMEAHLRALLGYLRPRYKTAIATNRTDTMERVLREHRLEGQFDMVVCAHDVPRPKPAPDALLKIMAAFDARPDQMVFIGDSTLDQQAADAAGVTFLAFANPALSAEYHIDSLAEVIPILETPASAG